MRLPGDALSLLRTKATRLNAMQRVVDAVEIIYGVERGGRAVQAFDLAARSAAFQIGSNDAASATTAVLRRHPSTRW
jgi:hypothetical protein